MAEGYAKELFPSDKFEIRSAGVEKHGLNKNAVQVMAEDGVDISQQYSKLIDLNYFNSSTTSYKYSLAITRPCKSHWNRKRKTTSL